LKESAVWYGNVAKAMETTTTVAVDQRKKLGALPPIVSDEDKKALKEQAEALDDIRRAAIPLTDAQKAAAVANEKLGISAGTTAKAFKISEAAVSTYLEGIKNAAEIEKMWAETRAKWAEETSKLSRKAADDFKKDQQQIADASAKVITERLRQTIDFETRNADAKRKGADLAIAQIERERDATIAALDAESEMRGPLYERDLAAIKKFYQNQIDLAKGTASTIEQRMRAQGVATREDLALSADAATRDYEQMRASGLYSTEEIQVARLRGQLGRDARPGRANPRLGVRELRRDGRGDRRPGRDIEIDRRRGRVDKAVGQLRRRRGAAILRHGDEGPEGGRGRRERRDDRRRRDGRVGRDERENGEGRRRAPRRRVGRESRRRVRALWSRDRRRGGRARRSNPEPQRRPRRRREVRRLIRHRGRGERVRRAPREAPQGRRRRAAMDRSHAKGSEGRHQSGRESDRGDQRRPGSKPARPSTRRASTR